jgi:hydrogenase/urease accessory protein HupE
MPRWLCVILLATASLHAHQIAEISMSLDVSGDTVTAVIEADAAYLLPELRGDEDEEAKDLAWLRQQGSPGWARIEKEAAVYLKECLRFEADGHELPWTLTIPSFDEASPRFTTAGEPEDLPMVDVILTATLPAHSRKLDVVWKEPFDVVLIATTGSGKYAETTPLVSGERATLAEREPAAPAMQPSAPSSGRWVGLGFIHILPEGVDHILFVLGLFLLVPKWKPLLQQTIVFTLAHSLSLAAASLGWVSFPATPVEVMIAASIAWVGLENLWKKELGKWRLGLVGIFGLIHGLGFAGVLAELLPADQPEKIPAALLGFNIGVELGQIAVLAIAFACFGWLDEKRFLPVKRAGSILVALAGLILIIERVGEIELVPFL